VPKEQLNLLTCPIDECDADTCCLLVTTTPAPTTTPSTCYTYTCPQSMVQRPRPENLVCGHQGCNDGQCCLAITTTPGNPCTTVAPQPTPAPATPAPAQPCSTAVPQAGGAVTTCAGFICDAPKVVRPHPEHIECLDTGCTASQCCLSGVGAATQVAAQRLYSTLEEGSRKEVPRSASALSSWALPALGALATSAMLAFFVNRVCTRQHQTRRLAGTTGSDAELLSPFD
jgi:hypothetical protein